MSMADIPTAAKLEAFEQVIDRYDTEGMGPGELTEILAENTQSINDILRDMGYADELQSADMSKSAGSPREMLKSFYNGNPSQTTTVNQELASDIEEKFKVDDVDTRPPEEVASLGVFYGGEVESAASSNRGDSAHNSGNQAE